MNDSERADHLEQLLATFLKPLKGIPFPVAIRAICSTGVEKMDPSDPKDAELIDLLTEAAGRVSKAVFASPILRPRPNEVGNDLEPFAMRAIRDMGIKAESPKSAGGKGQSTGYPDLIVEDKYGRLSYIDVKSYADGAALTTMRSFYMSPSANPKVCNDARHLVLGFGVVATPVAAGRNSAYNVASFKLIDLHDLECDVKYEFNSDNRRMYASNLVLASGKF
jgi:hypothetical protein